MHISSILGFLPSSVINAVYKGTKIWLHFFAMILRKQLANAESKVKVVEIAPPSVGTDLHSEIENSDDNKKDKEHRVEQSRVYGGGAGGLEGRRWHHQCRTKEADLQNVI